MPSLHAKVLKNNLIRKWKVLRGDLVEVISGKDKGKQGSVKKVLRKKNRVIVEGVQLVKKHIRKTPENAGSIITKEAPIHVSNVALVCPKTGKPTRIGYRFLEDGKKVRVAKTSGVIIPKPPPRIRRAKPSNALKDTPAEAVVKKTYEETEIIDLRNRYLKKLELMHFNHLRQVHENQQEKMRVHDLQKKQFEKQIYERAKRIVKQKMVEREENKKQ